MKPSFMGKIVQFYTYRTARLEDVIFNCEITSEEMMCFKKRIERQGYSFDNHICWKTEDGAFMYSDGMLYIGTKVWKEKW